MNNLCQICNAEFTTAHPWNEHHIKLADYFHKFFPRCSKLTGKIITFKSVDQYENADFENLQERNIWLKNAGDEAKNYILDLLIKRKIKKNWIYAPGQTQLKLANIPSILYFEKQFNLSFQEICKKLDFKIRFKNDLKIISKIDWVATLEVIQDTREQVPIQFGDNISISVTKLDYADYAIKDNLKIAIEKKSIGDLAGTMSAGYERFKRELARAKKDKGYIIILCDSSYNNFKSIEFLPQTKRIKASCEFLSKRIRDLYEEFDNFQLCFSENKKHSSKVAEFILKMGKKIKNIDLQYLIDSKII